MTLLTGPIVAAPAEAAGFDPDAYLREKTSATFDPDAYLREKHDERLRAKAADVGTGESFARGAAQGATLGFGDEIQGGIQAFARKFIQGSEGDARRSLSDLYREERDAARDDDRAAEIANKGAFISGDAVGGLVPSAMTGAVGAGGPTASVLRRMLPLAMQAGQGLVQGAGYSDADTVGGVVRDSALGGGVGLLGYGVGAGLSKTGKAVAGVARRRLAAAAAKAAAQAADEESAKVAALAGKYGSEVQKGSRQVENLMRLEPEVSPARQAEIDALRQGGEIPALQEQVAASTAAALPDQAKTIAAREAELRAAQAALPKAVADRTAELQKPQFGKDALSFARSYVEPVAAAYLGYKSADALGFTDAQKQAAATAMGLLFSRTRAGKALATRLARPGNQMAIMSTVEKVASAPSTPAGQYLRRAIAAASGGVGARLIDEAATP